MTNNEIFKKLLLLTGLCKDKALIEELFLLGEMRVSQSKIKAWRTDLSNLRASPMPDVVLEAFFQGLFQYRDIQERRGNQVFTFIETGNSIANE